MPKKSPIEDYKADSDIMSVAEEAVNELLAGLDEAPAEAIDVGTFLSESTKLEMQVGAETLKKYTK